MIFAVPSSKKESAVGLPPDSAFFILGAPPHKAPRGGKNYTDYNFVTELCISGVRICI